MPKIKLQETWSLVPSVVLNMRMRVPLSEAVARTCSPTGVKGSRMKLHPLLYTTRSCVWLPFPAALLQNPKDLQLDLNRALKVAQPHGFHPVYLAVEGQSDLAQSVVMGADELRAPGIIVLNPNL